MKKTAVSSLLLLAILLAGTVAIVPIASAGTTPPCFYFTENSIKIGTKHCNANANDLAVVFTQLSGTVCSIQFSFVTGKLTTPILCPKGANDVEVFWGASSIGFVITKCEWTHNGTPMTAACPVPKSAPIVDFEFMSHTVTGAYWTLNGKAIKPTFKAPTGANDVEFTT